MLRFPATVIWPMLAAELLAMLDFTRPPEKVSAPEKARLPAAGARLPVTVVGAETEPLPASVPVTVRFPGPEIAPVRLWVEARLSVPALMVMGLVKVLLPSRMRVPEPDLVMAEPPLIWATFLRVPLWRLRVVRSTMEFPNKSRLPPLRVRVALPVPEDSVMFL